MSNLDGAQRNARIAPNYRLLYISTSNEVIRVERLNASDDDVAIAVAQELAVTHFVELWDGMRFIERFEPQ